MTSRFEAFARRKERAALGAHIPGYTTREAVSEADLVAIGNDWSHALFDGPFYRSKVSGSGELPSVSLVFVQSLDGNTGAADPSTLGGGETDLHLVYEGLSRVDADAVMAGAATARGKDMVFSVWHPELVALRLARGKTRHPAQVVVTTTGDLRFDDGLMFLEPELKVFVVTRTAAMSHLESRIDGRPWIEVVDGGEPMSWTRALRHLRRRGIEVISCVGGARTGTSLIDEGLVDDLYLTTSARVGGEPGTPYYVGRDANPDANPDAGPPLSHHRVLLKDGRGVERGVRFEHLRLSRRFED